MVAAWKRAERAAFVKRIAVVAAFFLVILLALRIVAKNLTTVSMWAKWVRERCRLVGVGLYRFSAKHFKPLVISLLIALLAALLAG